MVSIILCFYNEEKYLEVAVKSILSQTYSDLELILINDASTDQSLKVAKSFNDSRIVIVDNEENHGLAWCRNQGLELARGKYIGFFDADDIAVCDKIEKQITFFDMHPDILVVSGNCDYIGPDGEKIDKKREKIPCKDDEIRARMLFRNCINGPCALFRREVIDQYHIIHDTDMRTSQDYHFWLNCMRYGKFENLDDILFHYRVHNSQSNQRRKKDENKYNNILMKIFQFAWESRGFRLTQEEINFIFKFFFNRACMTKLSDLLCSMKLYKKIKKQTKELSLVEGKAILSCYRTEWNNCMPYSKIAQKLYNKLKGL